MAKLSELTLRYKQRLSHVQQNSCAELSNRVLARTPVDSGSLRASWTPNKGEPVAINVDTTTGGTRHDITSVIHSLKLGDTYSLANGQPYARRIEYEGYSPQAPAGMLRVSVAEWSQIVAEEVKRGS